MNKKLILASASPRRADLLRQIGLSFETATASVDEAILSDEHPGDYATRLALAKARAVAEVTERAFVVGADTIVVLEDMVLGKPADAPDAIRMLSSLSGKAHRVLTGVALIDTETGRESVRLSETLVWFRPLDAAEISAYVETGEPLDKAGAYGIQERGALFVERIEGCYFNVVGLPLYLFGSMMRDFGKQLF